jgi:hypothetical protein
MMTEETPNQFITNPSRLQHFRRWLIGVGTGLLLLVAVLVWITPPVIEAGQVVDQFGSFRYPAGGHRLEIKKTDEGNVQITIFRRSTRYFFIPVMTKYSFRTFEAERDWFVSVDRNQRLWLFQGRWKKEWGKLREMPSGGTIPYGQGILMDGIWFLPTGQLAKGTTVVMNNSDWTGCPPEFFERIPGKDQGQPVWGGEIPQFPQSPPAFTKQQEKLIAGLLPYSR